VCVCVRERERKREESGEIRGNETVFSLLTDHVIDIL